MQVFGFHRSRDILIFHGDVAYRRGFLLKIICHPLPPLFSVPPSLDSSEKFLSHAYRNLRIKIATTGPFPSIAVLSFCGFKKRGQSFFRQCCPERLLCVHRSRSFGFSPPVSDDLCAQTKWRLVVSTPDTREGWRYRNIRREGGGERGRRGRLLS